MAFTPKAVNDHLVDSFGQVDEPVRSRTGNDGLIIGGICENSGTVTAVEHGDFAALHFDNDQNLMVNVVSGEIVASLGTIGVVESGTIAKVTSVANVVGGTIGVVSSVANLVGGTLGVVSSVANLVGGTVGVVSSVSNVAAGTLNTLGTVGVLNAGSVVVTAGTVTLSTLIAGEDQTNDVLKTENQFSYYHHVGTAGAVIGTVKASAGLLHAVIVNTVGTSPLTIYDSVGTSATVIGIVSGTTEQPKLYDVKCTTGITVGGTSVIDVTVAYR